MNGYITPADTNNNGIADYLDPNDAEACVNDADGDGIDDAMDLDDDNDGIYDTVEGDESVDSDGDGIPNYLDTDSDGDGCTDAKEAGYTDADADGVVDGTGIAADGTVTGSDGYSYPLDLNNNGVLDYLDATYDAACQIDSDGDGIDDATDLDDDNDGIYDTAEGDANIDTDGDGIPNYLDTDSDGDGCSDAKEAGFTDDNNDGEVDGSAIATNGTVIGSDGYDVPADVNNNGIQDYLEAAYDVACQEDADGDGIDNLTDLDDDNDGIYDTAEGDDSVDTDGDGIPNYLDTDSDGDGCTDAKEAGYTDANADGIVDGSGIDTDGTVIGSDGYTYPLDLNNNGVLDYLDATYDAACQIDSDGDGIDDATDLDDDNDGIYDTAEGDANIDTTLIMYAEQVPSIFNFVDEDFNFFTTENFLLVQL